MACGVCVSGPAVSGDLFQDLGVCKLAGEILAGVKSGQTRNRSSKDIFLLSGLGWPLYSAVVVFCFPFLVREVKL
jgi:hypothetical protein